VPVTRGLGCFGHGIQCGKLRDLVMQCSEQPIEMPPRMSSSHCHSWASLDLSAVVRSGLMGPFLQLENPSV